MDLDHLVEIGFPVANSGSIGARCQSSSQPPPLHAVTTSRSSASRDRPCVTRFAPSPTGYLHIGGARTALFNYLFAKHNGGQFRLRIEDTDAERNNEAAVDAIVQGMAWLGCKHDGEIVRQSKNAARHKEVAQQLLDNGGAYKCYCSKEDLDAMRIEAETKKIPFRYPGTYRDVPKDFVPPKGIEPVVRIKTPNDNGVTEWVDGVMGLIQIPNKDIDDFIILRADGTPTYLLAVVVDDHDMGITQVMRGSDHIPNTARQIAVFKNCGYDLPDFAHLPLIHGPDGKKMSKRHGATGAEEYEALGYLPEAMRNYLARLSWAHGNDEIFSTQQAIEWFDLSGCSKGAPCFDFAKLKDVNQHYIKEADPNRLADILLKFHPDVKVIEKKLRDPRIAELLKVRAKTMVEYREAADFMIPGRPIGVLASVKKNIESDAAKQTLRDITALLKGFKGEWSPESLEPIIKAFAEENKMKLGDVAKPLRAALTGLNASPGLFEVLWAVGKDESIGRLEDAAAGKNTIKEPPAPAPAPAKAEEKATPVAVNAQPVVLSGNLDAQATAVGDEIRALKVKLKADGISGKKIDKCDEVVALVAKLNDIKAAMASAPTKTEEKQAPAIATSVPSGDLDAQVKAVGDEIRELKAKLKADGVSGKKIDKSEEVIALVAKLNQLKAAA